MFDSPIATNSVQKLTQHGLYVAKQNYIKNENYGYDQNYILLFSVLKSLAYSRKYFSQMVVDNHIPTLEKKTGPAS